MASRFFLAALLMAPAVMGAAMPVEGEYGVAATYERDVTNVSILEYGAE
jgi:hypothetical protein